MRLSTGARPSEPDAIAVLHAALDAGVRLLDTADVYAAGEHDIGHNERLIARALASWSGEREAVTVATKGGLTRPGGAWVPDGRAGQLRRACEASLAALCVERIGLYQLHVVDPKTALKTSARALARLRQDGLVERVGLCNVTLQQLQDARAFVEVSAVQIAWSPWDDDALRGGVVQYCLAEGIDVLAHRPLGGVGRQARLARDPALAEVARRRGTSPAAVALAWLRSFDRGDGTPRVIPLPGPTRIDSARACGEALVLDDDDLAELDAAFEAADLLRRPVSARRPAPDPRRDVVIVMGMPGSGKSTHAERFTADGYARLNRDLLGGRLSGLLPRLSELLAGGTERVVLDNTYVSRARRNAVIETAWRGGATVRCVWLDPPPGRARMYAVARMLARHGRLLSPEEMAAVVKDDPGSFPPRVQLEYARVLEPPRLDEGFEAVQRVEPPPPAIGGEGRMRIFDLDRLLALPVESVRQALARDVAAGWRLAAFAWRPGQGDVDAGALADTLGAELLVLTSPHPAGPPICWCRPPMPGLLGVALQRLHAAADRSVVLGGTKPIERWAREAGLSYLALGAWLADSDR